MSNSDLNPYEGANSGSYSGQDPEQDSVSSESENVTSGHVGNNVSQMVIPNSYSDGSDSGQSEDNNATSGPSVGTSDHDFCSESSPSHVVQDSFNTNTEASYAWKGKAKVEDSSGDANLSSQLDINQYADYLTTLTVKDSLLKCTPYSGVDDSSDEENLSCPLDINRNTSHTGRDCLNTVENSRLESTSYACKGKGIDDSSDEANSHTGQDYLNTSTMGSSLLEGASYADDFYGVSNSSLRSAITWNTGNDVDTGSSLLHSHSSFSNHESALGTSNRRMNLDDGSPTLPYNLLSRTTRYWNSNPYMVGRPLTEGHQSVSPLSGGFNSSSSASSSFFNRPSMQFQWSLTENADSITHSYRPMPIVMTPPSTSPSANILADRHDSHQVLQLNNNWGDRFHDMRLDTDNMYYEELLALEDQIGNVELNPKARYMRKKRYGAPMEAEQCCIICIENLVAEDVVGVLNCAHDQFHVACIKEWLEKYSKKCPICMKTALSGK